MKMAKASHLLFVLLLVFSCFLMSMKPVVAATDSSYGKRLFNMRESAKSYGTAITTLEVGQEENVSGGANSFLMYWQGLNMGGESLANMGGMSKEKASLLKETMGDGVISDINKGIVALYNPPASARTYVADIMKSARIIPAAQAQGLGFSALDPLLETWKTFRNLAYLFFVVIFLVIGFLIMFRVQVHQAAITAQQAIPSVIVAMLAVTFSYAIAGFMIDLMYVVMYMLAGFFTEGPQVINHNMLGLVGLMFQGTDGVQETIEQFMEDALNIGWLGEALAWLSSLLGSVIIGVAVLFASFKVFFELVKTYVAVLIQIVFSPIILMFGAIPGKNVFGKWIKDLTGNLILWPVVLLCILVQRMLTAPIRSLQGTGNTLDEAFGGGFMPPFLVGQGQASIIPVIVGLGVLLVIPEIMQQVKKAMGVDEGMFGSLAKAAGGMVGSSWNGGKIDGLPFSSPFGVKDATAAGGRLIKAGANNLGEKYAFSKRIVGEPQVPIPQGPASVNINAEKVASTTTAKGKQSTDVAAMVDRVKQTAPNAANVIPDDWSDII